MNPAVKRVWARWFPNRGVVIVDKLVKELQEAIDALKKALTIIQQEQDANIDAVAKKQEEFLRVKAEKEEQNKALSAKAEQGQKLIQNIEAFLR